MTGKSLSWLKYDMDDQDKTFVKGLSCSACTMFDISIRGMKNYPSAWIIGPTNNRASDITDHGASEQHKVATCMLRLRTERAPVSEHCPIVKSLLGLENLAGRAQLKI